MGEASAAADPLRILVYCHNVHGLGHVTRSLRIVTALEAGSRCTCRLITGCSFLDRLNVPPEVEVVALPGLRKNDRGRLVAVDGSSVGATLQRRSRRIAEEVESWRPDVMLIDHNPLGLIGELANTLDASREGGHTRFVWGVRDIWGSAEYLERTRPIGEGPAAAGGRLALFHSAIAYTDPGWIDTFELYRQIELPARRASVGFVTGPAPRVTAPREGPPRVVALCGGGAGAEALMALLLEALGDELTRGGLRLRFVVGPFTPAESVRRLAGAFRGVEVWAEGAVEETLGEASLVVARVGYNTAYTLIQTPLPLVFVPVGKGNQEQAMRAALLARLPAVWEIDDGDPAAAARLSESVRRGLAGGAAERSLPFAVDGARRAADWLLDVAREARRR